MSKTYTFEITINDGFSVHEYAIETDGKHSVHDVIQAAAKATDCIKLHSLGCRPATYDEQLAAGTKEIHTTY